MTRRMLDVAYRHFLLHGVAGASLQKIAAEAGQSRQAIYSRYGSKADLFRCAAESRINVVNLAGYEFPDGTHPPRAVLREFLDRVLSSLVEPDSVALLRSYYGGIHRFPEIVLVEQEAITAGYRRIADYLADAARVRDVPQRDWIQSANILMATALGIVINAVIGIDTSAPERTRLLDEIVDQFLRGVCFDEEK